MRDESLTPLERVKEYIEKAEEYHEMIKEEQKKLTKEDQRELIRWFNSKRNEDLK